MFQPLPLFVRARTNPSKVIGNSTISLLAGRACQRRSSFANALVELALYDDNGCSGSSRYRASPVRGCPAELAEHVCAEVDSLHASHSTRDIHSASLVAPYGSASNAPSAYRCKPTGIRERRSCTSCCQSTLMHSKVYLNRLHTVPHEHVVPHTVLEVRETAPASGSDGGHGGDRPGYSFRFVLPHHPLPSLPCPL